MFRVKHALATLSCAFGMLVGLNSLFSDEPEPGPTESKSAAASGDVRGLPSVTGQRAETAMQVMKLAGYEPTVGVFYIAPQNWRDDIRPGVIYLQAPKARVPYSLGGSVGMWTFRKGKADQAAVSVPGVVGLDSTNAVEKLRHASLAPMSGSRTATVTKRVEPGEIEWQYPLANQKVLPGTTVFLLPKQSETE